MYRSMIRPFLARQIIFAFRILLVIILASANSNGQSGKITGEVIDSGGKPLAYANVFLNKTTLGDIANKDGSFLIAEVHEGTYELIGSFVGFSTYQKPIRVESGQTYHIQIILTPVASALEEVKVTTGRDRDWEKNLAMFKTVFIGTSAESRMCKIANPWVMNFERGSKKTKGRLIASASSPLEIENRALGYRVLYFLQKFSADFLQGSVYYYDFQGTMKFEEINSMDSSINQQWQTRRMKAYHGSYRHWLSTDASADPRIMFPRIGFLCSSC